MQATVGRIVHYTLTKSDAESVRFARSFAGSAGPIGNPVAEGTVAPAIVVSVFGNGEHVNLQVLLDGQDSLWATSRPEGEGPGTWAWPPRS